MPVPAVVEPTPRTTPVPCGMECDIMFVQGLAILICVILRLHFVMAAYLKHRTVGEVGTALELSKTEATAHGFDVQLVKSDGEKAVAAYVPELKR